jgi:hypothetical protein
MQVLQTPHRLGAHRAELRRVGAFGANDGQSLKPLGLAAPPIVQGEFAVQQAGALLIETRGQTGRHSLKEGPEVRWMAQ